MVIRSRAISGRRGGRAIAAFSAEVATVGHLPRRNLPVSMLAVR
ncbi:MAG: hypothetical protein WKF77_28940 [Planctomycetaceae bacterium]